MRHWDWESGILGSWNFELLRFSELEVSRFSESQILRFSDLGPGILGLWYSGILGFSDSDPLNLRFGSWGSENDVVWQTWPQLGPPKRSPKRSKITAKINQCLNASWDRIFDGWWWLLDPQMGPSWHPRWHQKSIPTSKGFFVKASFFLQKIWFSGGRSWE